MILLEDTRNQIGKHDIKHKWFAEHGIEVRRQALYCGDYTLPTDQSICIDTKKDIQELVGDICKVGRGEIYNPTITRLEDLHKWKNPRLFIFFGNKQKYPSATRGISLQKACITMQAKYGVRFLFCTPQQSAQKIVELLKGGGQD